MEVPRMVRTKYFAAMVAAILTVFATGCIVSFEPETAVNPVGTEHTVTVTLRESNELTEELLCNILEDAFEEIEESGEFDDIEFPENPCQLQEAVGPTDLADVFFEVISGPNVGTNSEEDGECDPSCTETDSDNEISWTYQSNGVAGTDIIRVCGGTLLEPDTIFGDVNASQLTEEELLALLEEIFLDAINDELGSDYESLDELECQEVEKTWVDPVQQRPNIGAGLSGLFAGQPTALPTAPAPAAVAPSTTIRPPSTGDAGLK
jgi:hypothetical protein